MVPSLHYCCSNTTSLRTGAGRIAGDMPTSEPTSGEDAGVDVCTDIDADKGGGGIDAWCCWARTAGRKFRPEARLGFRCALTKISTSSSESSRSLCSSERSPPWVTRRRFQYGLVVCVSKMEAFSLSTWRLWQAIVVPTRSHPCTRMRASEGVSATQ
jgi:hypothetical protein